MAGHIVSAVRKQRGKTNGGAQLAFFLPIQSQTPVHGIATPTFRLCLSKRP